MFLTSLSLEKVRVAELFQIHCNGCYANAENIVGWGKNLKIEILERNKLDSVEAIAYLVQDGKNNMSAYEYRLTGTEIEIVFGYVLKQEKNGWR